jgi:hypothetical protein
MSIKLAGAGLVSLNGATAEGPGKSFDVQGCADFGMQVVLAGEPTARVTLEASLDDPYTVPDANASWYTLATFSTADSNTSGEIITAKGTPVRRVRCNLATLTGGSSPTVTAKVSAA